MIGQTSSTNAPQPLAADHHYFQHASSQAQPLSPRRRSPRRRAALSPPAHGARVVPSPALPGLPPHLHRPPDPGLRRRRRLPPPLRSLPRPHHHHAHFTPCKSKPLLLLTWPGTDTSLPSILLNSHIDSVPAEPEHWIHPPFAAHHDPATGRVYARGAQDDKCLPIQYLEAIRALRAAGFAPSRTLHISLVPDEEIGGEDGYAKFVRSEEFRALNVGFMLDEGQASLTDEYRVFYADRLVWRLIVKATGAPGHGSKMFDGAAVENLMDCVETVARFREAQFAKVKAGKSGPGEVVSVNPVYMNAGTPSPTGFVMNMQPSEAEVGFDLRLPPTEDIEQIMRRIKEEWAPAHKNLTYQLMLKGPVKDVAGRPIATPTNESNPWWSVFEHAIISSGGKLAKPEILFSSTDARFVRQMGVPALGFSPMINTPILLHDHNEFLEDKVFLRGIEVHQHLIKALSSFKG